MKHLEGKKDDSKTRGLERLISNGTEIAGGAVGGALGMLAGDPVGAAFFGAAGATAGIVLKIIGQEISERVLSPRERIRVGGVLALVATEINQRLEGGESLRTDGFFDQKTAERSDAEEVTESILLKSQREPEEKKLPYMAHLLSSIAFDPQISTEMSHQIIKASEQLTYRQLCIMKIAVIKQGLGLRQEDYRGYGSIKRDLYPILYECWDLYQRGFINFGGNAALGIHDVIPDKMSVSGLGGDLFNLMNLILVSDEDVIPIVIKLK